MNRGLPDVDAKLVALTPIGTGTVMCQLCAAVKTDARPFKRCTACRCVVYCSVECQRLHWGQAHKEECGALCKKKKKKKKKSTLR
eukprot:TRINITY_DN7193_c0_g1_i1.p2 TRINITY_DN7193_c0_g1~~TRINITY_DN7193_c0_g1_i1.p2  ORF type:complete len:85 (+),score=34.04 TRINITY_DN7193_c0_g1_i1:223-477(+)